MIVVARKTWTTVHEQLVDHAKRNSIKEARLLRRFDIVTLLKHDVPVRCCAWYLDCSKVTVNRWKIRAEKTDELIDRKRAGRPAMFTEQMRLKVIGFYCQSPLPGCRMSYALAEKFLNNHLDVVGRKISASTIQRILSSHGMRPHLVRYFLQITDPDFFPENGTYHRTLHESTRLFVLLG